MKTKLLKKIYKDNLVSIVTDKTIENTTYKHEEAYVRKQNKMGIIAYTGLGLSVEKAVHFSYQMLDDEGKPASPLYHYHTDIIPGLPQKAITDKANYWYVESDQRRDQLADRMEGYRKLSPNLRRIFDNEFGCLPDNDDEMYGFHSKIKPDGKEALVEGMHQGILYEAKAEFLAAKYPQHTEFQAMCLV